METKRASGHVDTNSVSPVTARQNDAENRKANIGKNPFANLGRSLIELVNLKKRRADNIATKDHVGSVNDAGNRDLARRGPARAPAGANDSRAPIRMSHASDMQRESASTQGGTSNTAPSKAAPRRDIRIKEDLRHVQTAELADPFLRKFVDALALSAPTRSATTRSGNASVNETERQQDSHAKLN